ncbi:MAG TPA: hypothetical protein ENJ95_14030 [Bacteroidetes bacterium]|nr:hypothetical protein [Bacteroidota bacterium]
MQLPLQITPDYLNDSIGHLPPGEVIGSDVSFYKKYYRQQIDFLLGDYFQVMEKRLGQLLGQLEQKLENRGDMLAGIEVKAVQRAFSFLASWVLLTGPQKLSVDITADCSVFLTVLYPGKNAYFELFFEAGKEEPVELVFNVYKNKKPVSAYGGKFADALAAFLNQTPIEVPEPAIK